MKESIKRKRMEEEISKFSNARKILIKHLYKYKSGEVTFERERQIKLRNYTRILDAMEEYGNVSKIIEILENITDQLIGHHSFHPKMIGDTVCINEAKELLNELKK